MDPWDKVKEEEPLWKVLQSTGLEEAVKAMQVGEGEALRLGFN